MWVGSGRSTLCASANEELGTLADNNPLTHSLSTSVLVGISDSCSVVEMTSQTHYRLGAKLKRSAHADVELVDIS